MNEEGLKIIFLDIDGVLNSDESLMYHINNKNHETLYDAPYIEHVKNLMHIINSTGAKLVLSSTWRGSWHLTHLEMLLTLLCPKCNFEFVGLTPRFFGKERGEEIKFWLDLVKKDDIKFQDRTSEYKSNYMVGYSWRKERDKSFVFDVKSFVILDDDCDMSGLEDNFVHINNKTGLTFEDAEMAIKILNGDKRCIEQNK